MHTQVYTYTHRYVRWATLHTILAIREETRRIKKKERKNVSEFVFEFTCPFVLLSTLLFETLADTVGISSTWQSFFVGLVDVLAFSDQAHSSFGVHG